MRRVIDSYNSYIHMCEIIEKEPKEEHSFVVLIKKTKDTECETCEVINLREYEEERDENHIKYRTGITRAIIRSSKRLEKGIIFVHSHSEGDKDIELGFSDKDNDYYGKIEKIADEENFCLPIYFMLINMDGYVIKGGKSSGRINFIIPCSSIDIRKNNLHLFRSNGKELAYCRSHNCLIKVNKSFWGMIEKSRDKECTFSHVLAIKLVIYNSIKNKESFSLKNERSAFCDGHIKRLQLMIALKCNMMCRYCYAEGGNYGYTESIMDERQVEGIIDRLVEKGIKEVDTVFFFGGEPSLGIDTIQAACETINEYVKNGLIVKRPIYTIVTNGLVYSEKIRDVFVDNEIRVTVSMDGNSDINDMLRIDRSGKGTFYRVCENIQHMIGDGVNVCEIEATFTRKHEEKNITRKELMEEISKITGIKNIFIGECDAGNYRPRNSIDDESDLGNLLWETECGLGIRGEGSAHKCPAGMKNFTVIPNGNIYPCHRMISEEYYMGNIVLDDLTPMKNIQETMTEINKLNKRRCRECWAQPLCKGCPASEIEKKTYMKRNCSNYMKLLEECLGLIS